VSELQGDPALLLKCVGKKLSDLRSTDAGTSYRLTVDALECAAKELECSDFGLRLAARQGGTRVYGPMGDVMRNSKTFGDALNYVVKHAYVHSLAARIRLERRSDQSIFVGHDILLDRLPNRRQAMEQMLLLGHLGALELTGGRARARVVYLRHRPLSSFSTYRRYFGCEVRFEQLSDGLVFSKGDLQSPIIDASTKAFEAATSFIDASFPAVAPPLRAQARAVIGQLLGTPNCHHKRVAAELGLHPRTLDRRLQKEGTAFLEIKENARREAAQYYLQQTDLPLSQIAERLGYAEHSVFTRSCLRWFSSTPSQMRLQLS
jgi:AraC-like DNA-binding protein